MEDWRLLLFVHKEVNKLFFCVFFFLIQGSLIFCFNFGCVVINRYIKRLIYCTFSLKRYFLKAPFAWFPQYNSSVFLDHARMVENVWKLIKVTNVNAPTDLLDTTAKVNRLWLQLQCEPTGIVMSSNPNGYTQAFLKDFWVLSTVFVMTFVSMTL